MAKMKVLYLITKQDVGGAQKYVHDLADNLDKNHFEAKIIYGGLDVKWLSNKTYPWLLFINDWLAVFELMKIFKRERPDVIHLNSSKAGVIGSLATALYKLLKPKTQHLKPKVVFTAHGWIFNPTNGLGWLQRKFYIWLHKLAAKFQDKIINVSEYDHQLALCYSIAPKEKLVTIYNGIDLNIKFLDRTIARQKLIQITNYPMPTGRQELPITSIWIGSIGRLVKEKNYETFIRAAALMRDPNNPNISELSKHSANSGGGLDSLGRLRFFIIGDGYEKNKLQSLITHYSLQNKFFIILPTGEDYKYLKAFDIFVLPSIKEGLPYTILEAMTAEVPIVATDVGGLTEILKNNCGVIIAPRQPEKLATAIARLLNDAKTTANSVANASSKIRNEFSLAQMILKTGNIYRVE